MNKNILETREFDNYRIKVFADCEDECPCTSWDMTGCFLWEYRDIKRLADCCNWEDTFSKNNHSLTEALCYLVQTYVDWKDLINYIKNKKLDKFYIEYDPEENLWNFTTTHALYGIYNRHIICSTSPEDLYIDDYTCELIEVMEKNELIQILQDLGKNIFIKEWSSVGYCQGDYCEGVAFCTKDRFERMASKDTTDWKKKADTLIEREVKILSMWLWGDVKGFVVEKKIYYTKHYNDPEREDEVCFEWEEIDSCWGNYMETEELIEMAISENQLK